MSYLVKDVCENLSHPKSYCAADVSLKFTICFILRFHLRNLPDSPQNKFFSRKLIAEQ